MDAMKLVSDVQSKIEKVEEQKKQQQKEVVATEKPTEEKKKEDVVAQVPVSAEVTTNTVEVEKEVPAKPVEAPKSASGSDNGKKSSREKSISENTTFEQKIEPTVETKVQPTKVDLSGNNETSSNTFKLSVSEDTKPSVIEEKKAEVPL